MTENSDTMQMFRLIRDRFENLRPAMDEIGDVGVMAVRGNFEAQGRPRWKPHSPATVARRGVGANILIDKGMAGGLLGSIKHKTFADRAEVSAGKEYAATMHYGARKGQFGTILVRVPPHTRGGRPVRGHTRQMQTPWGNIPARPFMHITEEDRKEMLAVLNDYLLGGIT